MLVSKWDWSMPIIQPPELKFVEQIFCIKRLLTKKIAVFTEDIQFLIAVYEMCQMKNVSLIVENSSQRQSLATPLSSVV